MTRLLLALLVGLGLVGCKRPAAEEEDEHEGPIKVTCAPPAPRPVIDRVTVRGVVSAPPDRQALVAAAVAGRITGLQVQEGDTVAKGQLLAVIEDPNLGAAQGEADAQVATARAAAQAATAAAARAHRLLDEGIAARREVEDADARAAAAAGDLRAALARASLATAQRARAQLKAPIAGTVVRILRRPGELVDGTAATPVLELADPTRLELRADVAAADQVRLTPGQKAEVRLDALPDHPLGGTIGAVSPSVDPVTSLGWVRIAVEAPADPSVHPRLGLAGRAEIALGTHTGLAVPAAAVRRGAAGHPEVVVCSKEGETEVAQVREVTLGEQEGGTIIISKGLAATDQVIVDHALGLEDGAKITAASGEKD